MVGKTPDPISYPKRPLRVLSLFDGISTGLLALDEAGLPVSEYFASEIDDQAELVSRMHFGNRIVRLGDVKSITSEQIAALCPIDLLIGGSPCNDLSIANPFRRGLLDPDGTGILFFEYLRILKEVRKCNGKDRHLFWLYENVASMKVKYRDIISACLKIEPVKINARNFGPMRRRRLFWGNIPGLERLEFKLYSPQPILDDYIEQVADRTANVNSIRCITTNRNSFGRSEVTMLGTIDGLWITEIEQIFGFPRHFTDVGNLKFQDRQKLIGKAWNVQVAVEIFKCLKPFVIPLAFFFKNEGIALSADCKVKLEPVEVAPSSKDINPCVVLNLNNKCLGTEYPKLTDLSVEIGKNNACFPTRKLQRAVSSPYVLLSKSNQLPYLKKKNQTSSKNPFVLLKKSDLHAEFEGKICLLFS